LSLLKKNKDVNKFYSILLNFAKNKFNQIKLQTVIYSNKKMQDDANIQNLKNMLTNEIMINNENKDNELSAEKEITKEDK